MLESVGQPQKDHETPFNQETVFMKPTSKPEVMRTIQNLKNKSGGDDEIHASSLKLAAPYISAILADIMNYTFLKENVHRNLKQLAVICLVYKSGSKKQAKNFRPIALISNLAKILFTLNIFIRYEA